MLKSQMGLPEFESGSSAPKAERIPSYPTAPSETEFIGLLLFIKVLINQNPKAAL